MNVLKHPLRTGAGIGQKIFDTVDEKGLVYGCAYVATDILITKGIGKLAETAKVSRMAATKLEDVGRVANVTEDVGKGVKAVDAVEDAAKGVKAVDAVGDAAKGVKAVDAADDAAKGVGGAKPQFSEMSPEDIAKVAKEYKAKAPVDIPEKATYKAQSKSGYEQISYKWSDGTYKYEARWHTKTPGAPTSQGNTWVVERKIPGNGGIKPKTEILSGERWVPRHEWQKAIEAYQSGTATKEQLKMLEAGHWKER